MIEDWDADRELDTDGVRMLLRDQFPELVLDSVEHLGSGWDFDAYLIDDDLVIRFPRRAEIAELLDREERILTHLAKQIGNSITVPVITIRGHKSAHFPYPFFGHRFISGVAADHLSIHNTEELYSDLGTALTAIHSLPADAESEGIFCGERWACRERFEETLDVFEHDKRIEELVPGECEWLKKFAALPKEFTGKPVFIHNDFCPDHIIVDPETGRIAGIIDWSDATFGDPVWDFVVLETWGGQALRKSVLESYRLPIDGGFHERLRFLSRTSSLKWLMDAVKQDGDIEKHLMWVANAFAS